MKRKAFPFLRVVFACAFAWLVFLPARATAQQDPPSRIARLAYVSGNVSFQPAGTEDWIDATPNRPLTTGDQLWSDYGSRAALHIASASIVLSENTGFTFLNLADDAVQIQLTSGSIRLRVRRIDEDENFEIDTPNLAFSILRPGVYKISVNAAGDTTVIEDRHGMGEVTGGGSAFTLHRGDLGTFYGFDRLRADVQDLDTNLDDLERWCEDRDHREDVSVSARYVSDDAIGYEDLDAAGDWRPVPEYGMVWFPRMSPGWAPYHDGHWTYVAPWGYTWVDNAPWGFAPFHYGRWINAGGAWAWIPCPPRPPHITPEYVRPVYAPALVAWIGGPHFGIGISVGWFPLGPREVYVPSYPVSRNYITNVNVSNTVIDKTVVNNYYTTVVVNKTVNVTNVTYVNQRVTGAVTATTPQAFAGGQPVAKNVVRFDPKDVASAPVAAVTPPAVPQRAAVLGGRPASTFHPPAAVEARVVVVKTAPPPPPPTFEKRQAAIQSNGGHPLSIEQARQIAPVRAQNAAAPQIKIAPVTGRPVEPPHVAAQQPNRPAPPPPTPAPLPMPSKPAPQPAAVVNGNKPVAPVALHVAPPAPPIVKAPDPRLEQQHQLELANLQKQQEAERQKLAQQQKKEADELQKQKTDTAKLEQIQKQHAQQQQALAQKHQQEQQALQQKHQREKEKPRDEKEPK